MHQDLILKSCHPPNFWRRQWKRLKDGRSGPLPCLGYVLFYFVQSPIFLGFTPSFYSRHLGVEDVRKEFYFLGLQKRVFLRAAEKGKRFQVSRHAHCHHSPVRIQAHCRPKELENYGYLSIPLFTPCCASFGKAAKQFALFQI